MCFILCLFSDVFAPSVCAHSAPCSHAFAHTCGLSCALVCALSRFSCHMSHMCALSVWSHAGALACEPCPHMCALTCMFSQVCSYMCSICALMCVPECGNVFINRGYFYSNFCVVSCLNCKTKTSSLVPFLSLAMP